MLFIPCPCHSFGDKVSMVLAAITMPFAYVVQCTAVVLFIAPLSCNHAYRVIRLKSPLDRIPRDTLFHATVVFATILALPCITLALVWAFVMASCWLLITLPVGLWNFSRTKRSLKALAPYMGRPGVGGYEDTLCQQHGYIWLPADVFCGLTAAVNRKGFITILRKVGGMVGNVPWQHLVLGNPFVHEIRGILSLIQIPVLTPKPKHKPAP